MMAGQQDDHECPFSISPSPSRQVLPVRKVCRLLPPQELKHLLQSAQSIAPGDGRDDVDGWMLGWVILMGFYPLVN